MALLVKGEMGFDTWKNMAEGGIWHFIFICWNTNG